MSPNECLLHSQSNADQFRYPPNFEEHSCRCDYVESYVEGKTQEVKATYGPNMLR